MSVCVQHAHTGMYLLNQCTYWFSVTNLLTTRPPPSSPPPGPLVCVHHPRDNGALPAFPLLCGASLWHLGGEREGKARKREREEKKTRTERTKDTGRGKALPFCKWHIQLASWYFHFSRADIKSRMYKHSEVKALSIFILQISLAFWNGRLLVLDYP